MKTLFSTYFILLSFWGIAQENIFTITGKTNMNTFKCIDKNFSAPNPANNKITLNIADFDCKYDYITKDFRKTLSADKYPQIQINFGKFRKTNNGSYAYSAEVKLMNRIKTYTIELSENEKFLYGKQQVKFSDFGIIPPKKMAGMIVVKDELNLSFSFRNDD